MEVGFIMDDIIVGEGEGTVFVRVNISHEIAPNLTVDVQIIEGTATEREGECFVVFGIMGYFQGYYCVPLCLGRGI